MLRPRTGALRRGDLPPSLTHYLLDTKRYRAGEKDFQLVVEVDLQDGEKPVQVEVEFLAPKEVKLKKHKPN